MIMCGGSENADFLALLLGGLNQRARGRDKEYAFLTRTPDTGDCGNVGTVV